MERFNRLIQDGDYKSYLNKNGECEKKREFCKHNRQHFLEVARICYILALESKAPFSKEVIYTCAFLHDIGKWQQYTLKIPHEEASYHLAMPLLDKYGFNAEEKQVILEAVLAHRRGTDREGLGKLMYRSDKLSRQCYKCKAEKECDWEAEKKNIGVLY